VALFHGPVAMVRVRRTGGVTGDPSERSEMNEALTLLLFVFLLTER